MAQHSSNEPNRLSIVLRLGASQTLAWASSYYLAAILAVPMARDLGVSTSFVFGAFSLALVVSAAIGPYAGRLIDQQGGRSVLIATNVLFALGLAGLALTQSTLGLLCAWAVIGLGMGSGLYEAAFSTVVRIYGHSARNAITGITLLGGFASTVGWPLSIWMEGLIGWRGACLGWAALHVFVALPLHASLPRRSANPDTTHVQMEEDEQRSTPKADTRAHNQAAYLLALVFAITWFVSTAMAAHLPRLLEMNGASLTLAIGAAALVGPAQVAARLLEFSLLRRMSPFASAKLAALAHPVGAALLLVFGAPASIAFSVLHGAGNGILTIAKGTLPLVLFGIHGYGARQGWLMVPARIAQAFAPLVFGLLLEYWGVAAIMVSAALGMVAYIALYLIRSP